MSILTSGGQTRPLTRKEPTVSAMTAAGWALGGDAVFFGFPTGDFFSRSFLGGFSGAGGGSSALFLSGFFLVRPAGVAAEGSGCSRTGLIVLWSTNRVSTDYSGIVLTPCSSSCSWLDE